MVFGFLEHQCLKATLFFSGARPPMLGVNTGLDSYDYSFIKVLKTTNYLKVS